MAEDYSEHLGKSEDDLAVREALLPVFAEPYGELRVVSSKQLGKLGAEEPLHTAQQYTLPHCRKLPCLRPVCFSLRKMLAFSCVQTILRIVETHLIRAKITNAPGMTRTSDLRFRKTNSTPSSVRVSATHCCLMVFPARVVVNQKQVRRPSIGLTWRYLHQRTHFSYIFYPTTGGIGPLAEEARPSNRNLPLRATSRERSKEWRHFSRWSRSGSEREWATMARGTSGNGVTRNAWIEYSPARTYASRS
jgi:hypothetical protein